MTLFITVLFSPFFSLLPKIFISTTGFNNLSKFSNDLHLTSFLIKVLNKNFKEIA